MDKLQWGKRKRLRCVNVKNSVLRDKSTAAANAAGVVRRKISSCFDRQVAITEDTKQAYPPPAPPLQSPHHLSSYYSRDMGMNGSGLNENRTWSSPEKEDRYYTTRGSVGGLTDDNGGKLLFIMESRGEDVIMNRGGGAAAAAVWPKLYTTLSSKEKEEDFMAMKGCKLPQRPKKRAKLVQKTLLLGSPGAWLSDLCQERYEVREKKASKKRPRGLKAMGSRESDSD